MKSITRKKSVLTKRRLAIIIPAFLIIIGGGIAWAYSTHNWPFGSPQTANNPDNTVDTKEEYNNKNSDIDNQEETTTQTPPPAATDDKTSQTDNTVNQANAPETPNITRAEQSGSSIRVSAIFNNASNGKCVLRLEKAGSSSIVKEALIIVGPSYYVCNGFQVPRTELSTGGEWSAIVTHELNGKSSTSERKTFNVQ